MIIKNDIKYLLCLINVELKDDMKQGCGVGCLQV